MWNGNNKIQEHLFNILIVYGFIFMKSYSIVKKDSRPIVPDRVTIAWIGNKMTLFLQLWL